MTSTTRTTGTRRSGISWTRRSAGRTAGRSAVRSTGRSARRKVASLTAALGMSLGLGLTAALPGTAHAADNAYHPSDADFADCPTLPAGALQDTWTCFSMTALNGTAQLNTRGVHITTPMRMTMAQGTMATGLKQAVVGGLRQSGPFPMIAGIAGTPFESPDPNGWQVQFYSTPTIEPGLVLPKMYGVKARIIGAELSDTCYIGNETEPVIVRPQLQWTIPAFIDGVWVARAQTDSIFGMPNALGCGDAAAMLKVNALMNLPAPATADKLTVNWAIRSRDY